MMQPETAKPPADGLIGSVLAGRYRLDHLVGSGSASSVYSATHVLMHKRVAVKVLHRELTAVPEFVGRFEREARAAANIEHANVASALDFGTSEGGIAYLVLEFIDGRNLRDELSSAPFSVQRTLRIGKQIASGLAAAHAQGFVHRDLKPENIMLVAKDGDADFVKILDFGIAKGASGPGAAPLTRIGTVFGTPEYMAPEQGLGQTVDARADVYALGVILYEMLCGVRPYEASSPVGILSQQLSGPPPALSTRAPNAKISPDVERFVMGLLAREASERPASAATLMGELDALLQLEGSRESKHEASFDSNPTLFNGTPNVSQGVAASSPQQAAPVHKPTFLPSDPLPSFTFPPLDEPNAGLQAASQQARAVAEATAVSAGHPSLPLPAIPPAVVALPPEGPKLSDRALEFARVSLRKAARFVSRLCAWIDRRREKLPPGPRRVLSKVPAEALLGLSAALVVVPLIALTLLMFRSDPAELPAGTGERSAAQMVAPSKPEPPDKQSLEQVDLAEANVKQRKWNEAVVALAPALAKSPVLKDDPRVAQVLTEAVRHTSSASAAFALLGGPMELKGAEIIYDLAAALDTPQNLRLQAETWLGSEAFRKVAPESLAIAGALRAARTCKEKHALLDRAAAVGDARAAAYLKILASPSGCGRRGRDDCFPCMRSDTALKDAIAAIEARSK